MKRLALALSFVLLLGGCLGPTDTPETSAESNPAVAVTTSDWDVFGAAFETTTAVPVETVAADPDAFTDGAVRIVGTITEVCQGMGCWMTLQVPNGRNIRVVMPRDENGAYVFTLDRTISGRKAVVEGTLSRSTLAEFEAPMHEENQHDAPDASGGNDAHHAEGQEHTESDLHTAEIQLTASGVLVEKAL